MEQSVQASITVETNERQREYVEQQKKKGGGIGVVFADAFIRGMREIGYKSPSWSLAETIDNAIQATASVIDVRFGFLGKSRQKPDFIVIADNGVGMIEDMISFAVRWGGTDRENDRKGYGRYGYGLPSAAVNLACRYTVYSKTKGAQWNAVTVDLNDLAAAANDLNATERLLKPNKKPIPEEVLATEGKLDLNELQSGTVIVLETLDRLPMLSGWIAAKTLQAKLLNDLGIIYRHVIPGVQIAVNGIVVESIDPLFLMEHARFFSETPVRAQPIAAKTIEIETPRGTRGQVRIRASLLPPNFQLEKPDQYKIGKPKLNNRFPIMRRTNGILVCREGRQIDTISPPWTKFQNYDAHVKIEIDFDAELDEFFGITTSKQQIVIEPDTWERLKQQGKDNANLQNLVRDMRREWKRLQGQLEAEANRPDKEGEPRPSEAAMAAAEKFKNRPVPPPSPEKLKQAKENLEHTANEVAKKTGAPKNVVVAALEKQTEKKRWEVEFKSIEEGPFYIPHRLGVQKRLIINTAHPFYEKLFAVSPAAQSALEVMLFIMADGEIDAQGDRETFYKAERHYWSERLRVALNELEDSDAHADKAAAESEKEYEDA